MYLPEDGKLLIRLARESMRGHLEGKEVSPKKEDFPEKLRERAGIFVTLETYPDKELRGCIGYPEPVMPLYEGTARAAISAAFGDPRFPPLAERELDRVLLEVSILTPPEPIEVRNPKEYFDEIEIGRHGLIAERDMYRGLLLPQVPVDQGWDVEDFLCYTCQKAGLMPDAWADAKTKLYRFSGIVFMETEPGGEVVEKSLKRG